MNCDERNILNGHLATELSVVIPAYKESLETISETLNSLNKAVPLSGDKILVLLLINFKEKDNDEVKSISLDLYNSLCDLNFEHINLVPSCLELKGKRAGVGEARKILMDNVFKSLLDQNLNGLIVNLDADTTVDENYFISIRDFFESHSHVEAASIAFAHQLNGDNANEIMAYELHLRYFVNMQRKLHLPYAYQTVGSAMVVRRDAYAKEGGMVRRQAGEDFYFLHKYSKNISLAEINETIVYPSDRGSDRVPFGTGKAVNDMQVLGAESYQTYNPKSFEELDNWLMQLFNNLSSDFTFSEVLLKHENSSFVDFLKFVDGYKNLSECISNVSGFDFFLKRFFNWFDAFMLMKYLHYMRDHCYPDVNIDVAIEYLFINFDLEKQLNRQLSLKEMRKFDLQNQYFNQWRADLISKLSNIIAS